MGAVKPRIGEYRAKTLEESFLLDLNANGPIEGLTKALGHKNVVTELYHGNSCTTDPKWIKEFQELGFTILSFILNASLETHIRRLMKRSDSRNKDDIESHYNKFHVQLKSIFRDRAGIDEITVSTDEKDIEKIGDEILQYLIP